VSTVGWLLLSAGAAVLLYLAGIAALLVAGRRADAGALARFIPDCLVLLHRLIGDERIPRHRKVALLGLVVYLSVPIDLVPDFIPVVGQLDDVIVAALALRYALRAGGPDLLIEHWPGPDQSLRAVVRLAYGSNPR
jgi:uncharacterized membrane protein YkvA (DUF1232 family)